MEDLITKQIEIEKKMTETSIDAYHRELQKAKMNQSFGCTAVATQLLSKILDNYTKAIQQYLDDYSKGKAVRSTFAAEVINRLSDVNVVAFLTAKTILNAMFVRVSSQALYKSIGQALEDEYKMRAFKN